MCQVVGSSSLFVVVALFDKKTSKQRMSSYTEKEQHGKLLVSSYDLSILVKQ